MKNKLTLKQYLFLNDFKYKDVPWVSEKTIANIIRGTHDAHLYTPRYKGYKDYYPKDSTIEKIAKWLNIDAEYCKRLIDNQFKENKKAQ